MREGRWQNPRKILLLLLVIAMAAGLMAGCATSLSGPDSGTGSEEGTTEDLTSDLAAITKRGSLKIGIVPGTPLFYREEDSGEWTGYGADLARSYAAGMNLEAELIPVTTDTMSDMLESREIDCIWGRNGWTDLQKDAMSFSQPYLKNKLAVIVHFKNKDKEKCKNRTRITQMREFVVVEGSPGEEKARELGANYSTEKDVVHCLLRVAAGTASCALVDVFDSTSMVGAGTQYENLAYTVTFDLEEFSVGFRKDSDLVPSLDEFFAAACKDGLMLETAKKYRISKMIMEVK